MDERKRQDIVPKILLGEIDEKKFLLVKARSLAVQFMDADPTCVRAIPCSEGDNYKCITMYLYMHTGPEGITESLREKAEKTFADYTIEFVDLERRPPFKNVVLLPFSEKTKTKELSDLADIIDNSLGVFENRMNVTAIQPSYKITNAQETKKLCVAVFVLGKHKIPVAESDFKNVKQLSGYPYDIIEGYGLPASSPFRSKAFPLYPGLGIGVKNQKRTGTLGAILEDENNSLYILSCKHVLHPDLPEISDKIVQPSQEDYEANIETHERDMKNPERMLEACKSRLLGSLNEKEKTKWSRRVNELEEELRKITSDLDTIRSKKMPREIATYRGGVFKNVEKEVSRNEENVVVKEFWIDAAVAEICCEEETEIRELGFCSKIPETHQTFPKINEIVPVLNFAKEPSGKIKLRKIGRTTGYTEGTLQRTHFNENRYGFRKETCFGRFTNTAFEPYCEDCSSTVGAQIIEVSALDQTEFTCSKCDKEFKRTENRGTLWARNCFTVQVIGDNFSASGDSGALVYDSQDRAWGIITGGFYAGNSYVSTAFSLAVALEALNEELKKTLQLWCPTASSNN